MTINEQAIQRLREASPIYPIHQMLGEPEEWTVAWQKAAAEVVPLVTQAVTDRMRELHQASYSPLRDASVCLSCGLVGGFEVLHPCPTRVLCDELDELARKGELS